MLGVHAKTQTRLKLRSFLVENEKVKNWLADNTFWCLRTKAWISIKVCRTTQDQKLGEEKCASCHRRKKAEIGKDKRIKENAYRWWTAKIRKYLDDNEMSMREMSMLAGLPEDGISQILRGQLPGVERGIKLCRYLGSKLPPRCYMYTSLANQGKKKKGSK